MKNSFLCLCGGVFLTCIISFSSSGTKVLAIENEPKSCLGVEEFGLVDRNKKVKINDVDNPLFCTFVNQNEALEKLKIRLSKLLMIISGENKLDPIDNKNWIEYKNALYNLNLGEYNEANSDVVLLKNFFDIYENDEENEKILSYLLEKNYILGIEDIEDLVYLLPYDSPLEKEYKNNQLEESKGFVGSSIIISNAVSYANTYAVNPNTSGYGYLTNGDCTNFASQILEAGGLSQNLSWWHTKVLGVHRYSTTWTYTPSFASYMGTAIYSQHYSFSANLRAGDVILKDFTSDSSWDHAGFVTEHSQYPGCYPDGDYYNYKVAQHTNNYLEWASSSVNSWPSTNSVPRYGIVRK